MSCISSAVRLVLWFSKVQFLKRPADRVDYHERSEVLWFHSPSQTGKVPEGRIGLITSQRSCGFVVPLELIICHPS